MNIKRFANIRTAGSWAMALVMVTVLVLSAVSPAYAAGNPIRTISVGTQNGVLNHGTAGQATFLVTVTSRTSASNVLLLASGYDPSETYDFVPATLSFTKGQVKQSTLTIHTKTSTPASIRTITISAKAGKMTKSATATLTVNGSALTITADNRTKTYGDAVSFLGTEFTAVPTGVVTSVTLTSAGAAAAAGVAGSTYAIVPSAAHGIGLSNYLINYVNGALTVDKAMLTVTPDSQFVIPGDPTPDFTYSISGFVNGEDQSALTALPTCSAATPYSVGENAITCSGASAANYAFTYEPGSLNYELNNTPPDGLFLDGSAVGASIPEFQPANTLIGLLTASDPDAGDKIGPFQLVNYDAVTHPLCNGFDGDNASFQIGGTHGDELRSANSPEYAFDFETKPSLSICVEAQDAHGGTLDQPLTITISNRVGAIKRFASAGLKDGSILESAIVPGTGGTINAAAATISVGDNAAGQKYCSILSFNTASLPDDAIITSATLNVRRAKLLGSPFSGMGDLIVEMKQPNFGSKAGLQASDFQDVGVQVGTITPPLTTSRVYSSALDPKAFGPDTATKSTQLRLCFTGNSLNSTADIVKFYSGDSLTTSYRPVLKIEYSRPQVSATLNSNGILDGQVVESAAGNGTGGTINSINGTLAVGDTAVNKEVMSILSFDTAALPDNAVVTSVQLRVKRANETANLFTKLGALSVDLKQPFFGTVMGLQPRDFQDLADHNAVGTMSEPLGAVNGTWYTVDLDPLTFSSLTPKVATQLRLHFAGDNGDSLADLIKFYSGDATLANRPQLVITFAIP